MASPDRVGVWRGSVRFGLLLSYSRFDLTDGVRSRRSAPYLKPRFDPEKMLGHGSAKVGNATGSGPQTEIAGLPHPARCGRCRLPAYKELKVVFDSTAL